MLNKFKNFLITLTLFCFSFGMQANQNDFLKTLDFYSEMKTKQKKKKERRMNYSYSTNQNFISSKKCATVKQPFIADIYNEKVTQNSEYDMDLSDLEISFKIFNSKFGYSLFLQNQKLIEALKEMYSICFSDLDINETNLFDLQNFFDLANLFGSTSLFDLKKDYGNINVMDIFPDLEKINSINSFLFLGDIATAQITANNIDNKFLKNIGLEIIFNNYIQRREPQYAQRIFSMMVFEKDDMSRFDYLHTLIIAYLKNKDIGSAEKIAQSFDNELEKNNAYIYIIKYYTKQNDVRNCVKVFSNISEGPIKEKARIYLYDYFVRKNAIVKFQRCGFSSNSSEFLKATKFILAIYENNLQEAIQNQPINYEFIIENFIELLCSSNQIKQAEQLISTFFDESRKEDYKLYIINSYLKNGNFEEAKKVRNEIQEDLLDKWLASKLISIYTTK